jgi:hypothetical protein
MMEEIEQYTECELSKKQIISNRYNHQYYICFSELQSKSNILQRYLISNMLMKNARLADPTRTNVYVTNSAIIKLANDEKYELIHEIHTGLFYINDVLNYVPNYMRTYGHLRCGPYYGSGQPWTLPGDNIHLVAEYVEGDSLFTHIMNGMKVKDYLHVLIQLLCAIKFTISHNGFRHNDLHCHNVILRKCSTDVEYEEVNIRSHIMPIIIDYGEATISHENDEDLIIMEIVDLINQATYNTTNKKILRATKYITNTSDGILDIESNNSYNITIDEIIDRIIQYSYVKNIDIGIIQEVDMTTNEHTNYEQWKPSEETSLQMLYITNTFNELTDDELSIVEKRETINTLQRLNELNNNIDSQDLYGLLSQAIMILITFKLLKMNNNEVLSHINNIRYRMKTEYHPLYSIIRDIDFNIYYE